ncbi:unannotated protein [freshwater metagenome]|jgi:small basic protein
MKGLVKITGDPQSIMDNVAVFAALDTAFAAVRGITEYR